MNEVQMLITYNNVTQEEFERFEEIVEMLHRDDFVTKEEILKCLSFYVLKTYLLENKLI